MYTTQNFKTKEALKEAAPLMYEALHIIIQRASGTGNNMQLKRIIAIAQQAISKAEGKEV